MSQKYFLLGILTLPTVAFAQTNTVEDLLGNFAAIAVALTKLMVPLAMAFFFWRLITFIRESQEGKTTLAKAKDSLIFSGIILFVMLGLWTIVGYIQKSLSANGTNVTRSDILTTPTLPTYHPARDSVTTHTYLNSDTLTPLPPRDPVTLPSAPLVP